MKKVFFITLLSPLSLLAQKKQMTITLNDTSAYRLYNVLAVGQKYFAAEFGKTMVVEEFGNTMTLIKNIMDSIAAEDKKWHPIPDSLKNKK